MLEVKFERIAIYGARSEYRSYHTVNVCLIRLYFEGMSISNAHVFRKWMTQSLVNYASLTLSSVLLLGRFTDYLCHWSLAAGAGIVLVIISDQKVNPVNFLVSLTVENLKFKIFRKTTLYRQQNELVFLPNIIKNDNHSLLFFTSPNLWQRNLFICCNTIRFLMSFCIVEMPIQLLPDVTFAYVTTEPTMPTTSVSLIVYWTWLSCLGGTHTGLTHLIRWLCI